MTAKTTYSLPKNKEQFSAFSAVFVPVILTLLSVAFFLRLGYLSAIAGPFKICVIITIATCISFVTALSISSTATNIKVDGGGIYCLLSRTFGIEVASAISLPLYFAQGFSVAFYIMGFSEALTLVFPALSFKTTALVTLLVLTTITCISPKVALKTQFFIFIFVTLALTSFFLGCSSSKITNLSQNFASYPKPSFWILFAIFFPSVTGIEGGLALMNDLKNPRKSLPLALLLAIGIAFLIYLLVALLLYFCVPNEILVSSPLILSQLSLFPPIVLAGICASTLSGSLSMLLAAPRMLEALAKDSIIPSFLGRVFGKSNSPRIALIPTCILALFGLSFSGINTIAPILSMFFLISYAMINSATAFEAMIANPSWRPTFKTPWFISLFGAFLCAVIMLLISPAVSLGAFTLVICLYFIMKKRNIKSRLDDFRHSILLFFARFAIYRLSSFKPSAQTWRPNLLVFVGDPLVRKHLIEITSALTHRKGFLTATTIVDETHMKYQALEEEKLSLYLSRAKVPALVVSKGAKDLMSGMTNMIEHVGIGPLSPNTVVLGATHRTEKFPLFTQVIKTCYESKKNIVIINGNSSKYLKPSQSKKIDVWWAGGCKNNPELMLVLAYMLQTSHEWKGSQLSLKTAVTSKEAISTSKKKLDELAESGRLQIDTQVVLHNEQTDIFQKTIKDNSKDASLILLGLKAPTIDETVESYSNYYHNLLLKTQDFPTTAFILCGEELDFHKILK